MRRSHPQRFYVYTYDKTGEQYFHNTVTNEVTWFPPLNSVFIDPKTMAEVKIKVKKPQKDVNTALKNYDRSQKRASVNSCANLKIDNLSDQKNLKNRSKTIMGMRRTIGRKSTLLLLKNNHNNQENLLPIYLPQTITNDAKSYDIRKFANENFNVRMRGSIFNKREIPPEELFLFSNETSILPILKSTPANLKKKCDEIFRLINEYCLQNPRAQPNVLVELVNKERSIIDEAYIILLKQTRNNPSEENTNKVWDLLLTMATFFPPSKNAEPLIKHVVAVEALGTNPTISNIAKITYIRLSARCDCGEIFPMQPKNWTNMIPTHYVQDSFIFGAPLLELIYAQRRSAPKCTIPLFLNTFAYELIKAGITKVEGTFRLPGNIVKIDHMVEEFNNGKPAFKGAELRDLASLFKRWLADLPEPIIPMCMYDKLVAALNNNTVMDFLETLPKVNHDTLGFLVGFLQGYVKAEPVTKMGIVPVSMIFGANVVRIVSNDPMVMKTMTDNGKKFMQFLLTNWDTSFIYPLPIDFIT